ncbi:TonB-dependent receptor [Sphingomonas glacialis]|uniref:TonB-dependent receptor n=1 Tax=Sphingomonas glacialis TaxID=658225 RepID=A0ABQ3LNS3_9SPHN|nr:TonB-dependent siderophore receptor [Sphingomonas glacialis]GHH19802.1 TonB-dependent receptor [Sphingomonas glacialis]
MPRFHLLLVVASILPLPAVAADKDEQNQTIVVTGKRDAPYQADTAGALKTDTPLKDTPQTISVVTAERIADGGFRSIADALQYVPGVTVGQGEGNTDQIAIRGQVTTASFFLDGVRDDVEYFRPLYNLSRIEVIKGSNALLFGRGSGGGVINRVTLRPELGLTQGAVQAGVSSFGGADAGLDLNLPLGRAAAARIDGFYEHLENHRDNFGGDRWAVNPQLLVEIAPSWRAGIAYEHVDDTRVADRGVPSIEVSGGPNRPLPGRRQTFFGLPGFNSANVAADITTARLDGELAPDVTWSSIARYAAYDKSYANVYPDAPATSPTGVVALAAYANQTHRTNWIVQSNIVAKRRLFGVSHTLLIGAEYGSQKSSGREVDGIVTPGSVSVLAPAPFAVALDEVAFDLRTQVDFFSLYAQDQISFAPWLDLIAGVRWDRFAFNGNDLTTAPIRPFARTDSKFSPRLGVVLKPTDKVSLYGSYARSFQPRSGDQFVEGLTADERNLEPESYQNYEIGAKWQPTRALIATIAAFRLDRTNATTPAPNNPLLLLNIGATRTEGVEAEVTGQLLPTLNVSASYTWLDARLRGNDSVRLAQTPRARASFWAHWQLNPRIGLAAGVVHQSTQFAAIRTEPTTTLLPAFTRLDVALSYRVSEHTQVQLNVENLTNTRYFSDAYDNNNISTGAPINARLTIRTRL